MRKNNIILSVISGLYVFFIYRNWFSLTPLSAGDWSYHTFEEVARFFIFPQSWIFWFHGGLGGNGVFFAGLETYFLATARLFYELTGLPWAWSERFIWYMPFLLLGVFSSLVFAQTVLPTITFRWMSAVIFLTNTYILIITGGGQMGIAMAYAIAPLVFAQSIKLYQIVCEHYSFRRKLRQSIWAGFSFAAMTLFDPRIVYILTIGIVLYWIIMIIHNKKLLGDFYFFGIPFVIVGVLHAFWLLPLVVFHVQPIESLGSAYNSIASVKFFSFGDFSHALSLLHPNWPENIFGKVYFLQPEFLIIPLVAWGAFVGEKDKKRLRLLISCGFIALLGIFLAKGANDPGGAIYLWIFTHLPGFNVFRDPTKFYLLIALAYSVMIPVAVDWVSKKMPRGLFWKTLPAILFVLFWLFTIRQAIAGQLSGTFIHHAEPQEYKLLADFIDKPEYFRTFWLPHVERYGLSSYVHPAVDAATILDTSTPSAILTWMDSKEGIRQLSRWSVKYVILPYDSQGEIFMDDRKYSEKERIVFEKGMDANKNLKKKIIPGISTKLSVYETPGYADHLWLEELPDIHVSWHMSTPTLYLLTLPELNETVHLIFTETYDPYWQIRMGSAVVKSQKTKDNLNSFVLPPGNAVSGVLEYIPQKFVRYGMWISGVSLVLAIVAVIIL